jgi:hypothetical protein
MGGLDAGRGLAFIHPLWMVLTLVFAFSTARMGLRLRRARIRREVPQPALRVRHLRFGKATISMVVVGFAAGPPSMIFVREQAGFDSFHAILGLITLGLHLWTGWSGRALARGRAEARDVHRIAAAAALATSMLAAVAGFGLLP